jgi:hypothetical protein
MKSGIMLFAAGLLLTSAAIAADEAKLTTMNGTVVSTDASGLVVKVDQGSGRTEDVTVLVAPDTKIIKAGKKIALTDVTGGEKVTVNYKTVNGKKQAVSIGVESTA